MIAREITLQNMRIMLKCLLRPSNTQVNENCIRKNSSFFGKNCARLLFGQNWITSVRDISQKFNHRFTIIAECFEKQCSFLAMQRMRRTAQLLAFYNRLYGEKLIDQISASFFRRMNNKPLLFLLGASLFSWEENKITDDELNGCVYDMDHIQDLIQLTMANQPTSAKCEWEKIIDEPKIVVWRRPVESNPSLFQYKVYGKFDDVPARAFFNTQLDFEFRKQWDKIAIDIRVVDRHESSGCEVIHWTTKFPYPLYNRDYLYVRRYMIDPEKKVMALYSRGVTHPNCPVKEDVVRITDYQSALVIHPYTDFDENGCQYVMTYYHDPQTTFPSVCYNWLTSTGVPDYVDKLHKAAKLMHERTQKGYRPVIYQNTNQNNHTQFSMPSTQYA